MNRTPFNNININVNNVDSFWIDNPFKVNIKYLTPDQLGNAFKPERTGKNGSHVVIILDDSGSMQSCRDTTISGLNEFVGIHKADYEKTGIVTLFSLFKFDGYNVSSIINRVDIREVKTFTQEDYDPKGMTNLYDAIGGVIQELNRKLKESTSKVEDRESIIIATLTDGAENSSKVFSSHSVKQMVSKAEDSGWGFVFLGANIDAFGVSSTLGFRTENTMQYSTDTMENAMRSVGGNTTRMKAAFSSGMSTVDAYTVSTFTDQERSSSNGGK
jgi:hypothetical protein